jgi:hypothetical protein
MAEWLISSGSMTYRGEADTAEDAMREAIESTVPDALGLIVEVIELWPEDIVYYDTVALLKRMGRYEENA